jgi:hypothetical protein
LGERIADHDRQAERWRRELLRTKEDETEDAPLLPDHMCEHEEQRHLWRSDVLAFIRDHIEAQETYRVGAGDLEFGELSPPKPGSVEQEDYEERMALPFRLEQLTKRVGELSCGRLSSAGFRDYETPDGYTVSRVDIVENGPEIIRIDRK